jgi:hypothetical protein
MNYEYISDCLNICQEHINEGGGKITSVVLSGCKIPDNIKNLIKDDYKIVKKIIDFYYNDFIIKSNLSSSYEEAFDKIEFIKNKTNDKKIKIIEFNEEIIKWLKTTEFFSTIYEYNAPIEIDESQIQPINNINKFIPRENQQEAFDLLEKDGLVTGIHCQATGCGKTFIIIKYIDYVLRTSKKPNPKIILFTERVNILSDLFSFKKGNLEPDIDKLIHWKNIGVGDLTKCNIINRVTNKNQDWVELVQKSKQPTLLVINRAFLTLNEKYKNFEENDLDLVLHDECHNTSSQQCHKFLKLCKTKYKIPIVGFSATPLRSGKFDKPLLLEIYAKPLDNNTGLSYFDNKITHVHDELNLLTNYNMIYAISKNLILAPEFFWYQFDKYNKEDSLSGEISEEEVGAVFEILDYLIPTLPNKKIIAWCGTITLAKAWKKKIEATYKQRRNLKNFLFGLDTSESNTFDYEYFSKEPKNITLDKEDQRRMYYGNSILFCANKHREGSDIKLLDACIFLDKVKDRGSIPFIQSIGRTLRICPDTETKTKGVVIDGFVKDTNNYEKQFIDKIIGYYLALENITNINDTSDNNYEQYIKMKDIVKFDKEKELINMKLGNKTIKIHCNKLEWNEIINKFDKVLQNKIKISPEEAFNIIINKIKELEQFQNPDNDFWKEYEKLDHDKLSIPKNIYNEYKQIWENKTWYDILGFKNNFYSYEKFKNLINEKYLDSYKKYKKYLEKNNNKNYPIYPNEYYRLYGWNGWNILNNDDLIL